MPSYYSFPQFAPNYALPIFYIYPSVAVASSLSSSPSFTPPPAWFVRPSQSPSSTARLYSDSRPPKAPRPRTIPLPLPGDHADKAAQQPHAPMPPRYEPGAVSLASSGRPIVDPILAVPHHPVARPYLTWDLMYDPSYALLQSPNVRQADLSRVAIRSNRHGGGGLRAFTLMLPFLPMEIDIRPSSPRGSRQYGSHASSITVWDVLEGLYHGLRSPIEAQEFMRLDDSGRRALSAAADVRCRRLPDDERSWVGYRKIDYLQQRRYFLGIRPALRYELPAGRKLGEVFIVLVSDVTRSA